MLYLCKVHNPESMKLQRKFDSLLSKGRGSQLIWLAALLLVLFFMFWGLSALFFKDGRFTWQDIAALILDPGSFGGAGSHDIFRLVLSILGAIVFASLLINVIGNIFENIIESYNKGESRYSFKGHILILGSNRLLPSMLSRLLQEDTSGMDPEELAMTGRDIVIMTSSPVEQLRGSLEAFFGESRLKQFRSKVTFYHDDRDNTANLERACAGDAWCIYLLGEENETGHDSINISCLKKLEAICQDSPGTVRCFVTMESGSSADILHYVSMPLTGEKSRKKLLVNTINLDEYIAEQTLLGVGGKIPIDGAGQKAGRWSAVRFVIAGMSPMGMAMAKTAAHLCHFKGEDKSVITFIQSGIRPSMEKFIAENPWLFRLSHYTYIKPGGKPEVHLPDKEYGDLLDIKWEFIDAGLSSPDVGKMLETWAKDSGIQLSLAICTDSDEENMSAALHLPGALYRTDIPIYVHTESGSSIMGLAARTGLFGSIRDFGAGTSSDSDPLLTRRSIAGRRVNYVYSRLYGNSDEDPDSLWYSLKEADKFSSIYYANSIPVRLRTTDIPGPGSTLDKESAYGLCRLEHDRWMMTELLMGFKPYSIKERKDLISKVLKEVPKGESPTWKSLRQARKQYFTHIDIAPFDELVDEEEKLKDINLMVNIPFILGETSDIYRFDISEGKVVRI